VIPLLALTLTFTLCFAAGRALVSVYPFYDLVRTVSGERYEVSVLIPPRADYHLYELTAGDLLKLTRADILFVSGVPLGGWEEKAEEIFRGRVVHLTEGLELLPAGDHGPQHRLHSVDPHVWLSPSAMKKIARGVFRAFVEEDPAGEDTYRKGFEEILRDLSDLDREYRTALRNCRYRVLPVVHPALGYLARDYRLVQLSLSGTDVHGDVSPARLAKFVGELKRRRIPFVFTVKGERSKLAELLREEYGLKLLELNVKIVPDDTTPDYFAIMRANLTTLREALRCR